MNWLRSIDESRLNEMFHRLANELIEKELLDNPQELTSEQRAEIGLKLTVAWQEANADDMELKLVEKYGTVKDNLDYSKWKESKEV